jgi:glycosyltransferase involved in cell wall biosynthesis
LTKNQANISVIIPAYNRANLIGETLRSLLNQTLQAKEIIVVDDGSTDGTAQKAEDEFSVFRQQFSGNSKFKIPTLKILCQENAGPGAARNRGLAESTGEFIHFFDSDDIAAPNKHEVQLKALLETGADIAYGAWVKGRFAPPMADSGSLRTEGGELIGNHESHEVFKPRMSRIGTDDEAEAGLRLAGQAGVSESDSLASKLADSPVSESPIRSADGPASSALDAGRWSLVSLPWSFTPDGPVLQAKGLPKGNLVKALLTDWSVVPHACLFRRSIVETVGGFPEDLFGTEDQMMFLRCLLAGAKVVHSPGTMEFYRVGDPSKITATGVAQKRHAKEWAKFLLKANEEVTSDEWRVTSEGRRLPAEALGREGKEILTTEDTENTEDRFAQKQACALTSQAGAPESDPLASELARDSENTSLNRSAIGPAPSPDTRNSLLATTTPSAWFGFRLRGYEAWRDLRAFFPGEYLDLESGLEGIWKRSKFSDFRFQFSGFLQRKLGGLKQRFVGHRWSRAFRCELASKTSLEGLMK